jgi:peptidyl-prolyl cis-trans isomerase D
VLQQMRSSAKYVWIFLIVAFIGGFLLYETSGLIGAGGVRPTTPVATVNGRDILYQDWYNRAQRQSQEEQQRIGRSLTQDEYREVEDAVLEQMIMDILLEQEYRRRGIRVSEDEIRQYARYAPPSWLMEAPDLQTDGRFDPAKYERLLASPAARQQGLLTGLEQYYRTEIPRQKLYEQIMSGVFVTDLELWRFYQDLHDSARVSFVAFRPPPNLQPDASIGDAELRRYFNDHREEFRRTGRAVLSVVSIPRAISAADTLAARERAASLRAEILGGASFDEVARRESTDTLSGAAGGDLGRGPRGRFVPEFERAAYDLRVGEVSQPVLSPFGYHVIRVDERAGDTLSLRHILVAIEQSDSAALAVDRRADELATMAAGADRPAQFDSAAQRLGLEVFRVHAFEGQVATHNGRPVPSVSAWAFSGSRPGEISDLLDSDEGYFLARLDSLAPGGEPRFESARDEIRMRLTVQRALEALVPEAERLASAAAGSSLEAAAAAQQRAVETSPMFVRSSFVPGLGQLNAAVGAAFGLPAGAISQPIRTDDGVYVLRTDARSMASRPAFEAERATLRQQRMQQLRQQRVQAFFADLRQAAKVQDKRRQVNAMARRIEG